MDYSINGGQTMEKIKNNWPVKLISLIVAIFLWAYVVNNAQNDELRTFRNIPVELKNMESINEKDLLIMEPKDPTVTVKLRGKRSDLLKIQRSDISVSVDLDGYGERNSTIPINVIAPPNTTVSYVSKNNIMFKFEKLITKDMDIEIETIGNLPSDHLILTSKKASPEKITLKGASSQVSKVKKAKVVVDASTITKDTNLNLPVQLEDENGELVEGVELSQGFINVSLSINSTKEVPIKLKTTGNPPEGINISKYTFSQERVSIVGAKETLDSINSIDTKPIDLTQIKETTNINIDLDLPEGIFLSDTDKKIILNIKVDKLENKEINIPVENIIVENLGEGLNWKSVDNNENILIDLEGGTSDLDKVNGENIKLKLNLAELEKGRHTVDINLEEIEGVKVNSIKPSSIKIEIY